MSRSGSGSRLRAKGLGIQGCEPRALGSLVASQGLRGCEPRAGHCGRRGRTRASSATTLQLLWLRAKWSAELAGAGPWRGARRRLWLRAKQGRLWLRAKQDRARQLLWHRRWSKLGARSDIMSVVWRAGQRSVLVLLARGQCGLVCARAARKTMCVDFTTLMV